MHVRAALICATASYLRPHSLYGITTCQTVIFFRHAGKDPLILKCIVSSESRIPLAVCDAHNDAQAMTIWYQFFLNGNLIPTALTNDARICETLHTGMHSQALYFYVVQSRGNTTELEKATW